MNQKESSFSLFFQNIIILMLSIGSIYISHLIVINNYDDNILYSLAYEKMAELPFLDAYDQFVFYTGGSEPIFFLLSYFSQYLSVAYSDFIFIINSIFLYVLYKSIKYYYRNYEIIFIITLITNFYLYVFLSDVHRLKLALTILMIFFISSKFKSSTLLVSSLTHFQIIFFIAYNFFLSVVSKINKKNYYVISKRVIFSTFLVCIVGVVFLNLFFEQIINKFTYYSQFTIPWRVLVLSAIYLGYLHLFKLKETLKLFYPLAFLVLVISFIVGADRTNFIIMEFIFFVELNRGLHKHNYAVLFVTPFIMYNFIKMIMFIKNGLT